MSKLIIYGVAGLSLLIIGAGSYQVLREEPRSDQSTTAPAPSSTEHGKSADSVEIQRKTLDGIGSINTLKPVPLPPTDSN